MRIRFGIRWDGRGKPRPAGRLVALTAMFTALLAPAASAADTDVAASLARLSGGAGLAGVAGPDGSGVDVAVIDSGVMPVLSLAAPGRVVHGPDFSDEAADRDLATLDTFGHGTHIAGLIAGRDNVTGFAGVAPGARIVSLKVAGADGETSLDRVIDALEWVRRNHDAPGYRIRVVNLSFGVEGDDYRSDLLAWKAEQLWHEGIVVVAAAGNAGNSVRQLDMPAADPYVIAAGATDTKGTASAIDDRVADFSSRGELRAPDVVAPGTSMLSLRVPGSTLDSEFPAARAGTHFFRGSGTSQSTAVVSGMAARLISVRPHLLPDQVKALLVAGAVGLPDARSAEGAGRADLARSAARSTPDRDDARQRHRRAALVSGDGDDDEDVEVGEEDRYGGMEWSGRRWSGRRWSGRRWSGATWCDTPV